MLLRPASELNFAGSDKPMPTVEIDLHSLNITAPHGYAEIVEDALKSLAEGDETLRASVWVYQGVSCHFLKTGYSSFFAVAGRKSVLTALHDAFLATPQLLVRYSDQITQSQAVCQFHIEDGRVWREFEPYMWCAGEPAEEEDENWSDGDEEESISCGGTDDPAFRLFEPIPGDQDVASVTAGQTDKPGVPPARRPLQKGRTQRARSDASLGSISRSIETLYGLPEGSVALRGPDRRVLRKDATVGTLRSRWE